MAEIEEKLADLTLQDNKSRHRTSLVYDERMAEHRCLWDSYYPECPERLTLSLQRCRDYGLVDRCNVLKARPATNNELLLLHDQEHIDLIKTTKNCTDEQKLEELSSRYDSVYFHPVTYDMALLSVGSTIDLISSVVTNQSTNGMAIIRPPGHHAMQKEFCGYCFFNNVAIAAKYALNKLGTKKVLIVDWDVHHGQATQYMFYDDPRVLYFSIHRYEHGEFWPELQESNYNYIGKGKGRGFNINVPLNQTGMTNSDYMAIFNNVLLPVAYEFCPDLVLVSSGFDAALGCPEGEMEVTPACYAHLLHSLMGLAGGKVCVVLEGGYCLKSLSEGVALSLRCLLGDPCPKIGALAEPCDSVVETILNVITVLRPYWRSLAFQGTHTTEQDPNNNRKRFQSEDVPFKGKLGLCKPERFATRECYLAHNSERKAQLDQRIQTLIQETDLSVPTHRTSLAFDQNMSKHQSIFEKLHPEKPERILKIYAKLKELSLVERCLTLPSRCATEAELALVHDQNYIELMRSTDMATQDKLAKLQEQYASIYLNQATYRCACLSAGCLLQVVDAVLTRKSRNGVAVIRPPGHHAEKDKACGFCIFNNVCVAARYALSRYSLKRILVVDWDVHHGNGTQHQFYDDPRVLYISLHRYDNSLFFPFSYEANSTYTGEGSGQGFNVNVPWNKGRMGDGDYLAAFFQIVLPIAQQFDPELVLVSSGFDAARGDPLGGCLVSPETYGHLTHLLMSLAGGKVVVALEGGYNVPVISSCMAYVVSAALGDPCTSLSPDLCPSESATKSILGAVQAHCTFWPCLKFDVDLPTFVMVKAEVKNSPNAFEVSSLPDEDLCAAGGKSNPSQYTLEVELDGNTMFAVQPLTWCPHLSLLPSVVPTLDPSEPCQQCLDISENWVCLHCLKVLCGRYVSEHMVDHWQGTGHALALSYSDFSVWCYECDSYVDNEVFQPIKNEVHEKKFGVKLNVFN